SRASYQSFIPQQQQQQYQHQVIQQQPQYRPAPVQSLKSSNLVPPPQAQVPLQPQQPLQSQAQQAPENDFFLDLSEYGQRIRVCVRKRPLNKKELTKNEKDILENSGKKELLVHEPKVKLDMSKYTEKHKFVFDEVFDENSNNYQIYLHTAYPLVDSIFHKGKATCFAYGQTGSGKTFTMMGCNGDGIYALAARDIFHRLNTYFQDQLEVYVSFFEIYGGKLFDLLHDRKQLACRENEKKNVIISGLGERRVSNAQELMGSVDEGNKSRSTGSTGVNADSSRSHAVLQISLKNIKTTKLHGKFSFIDLAGSERGGDTYDNDKQTRKEGADINKSLLALKECIRALDQSSKHTPFRQSTLTQVLKDSFIGNSRTVMIANVSPNHSSSEHTLNTLRYAYHVKELGSSEAKTKIVHSYNIPAPLPPPDHLAVKPVVSSTPDINNNTTTAVVANNNNNNSNSNSSFKSNNTVVANEPQYYDNNNINNNSSSMVNNSANSMPSQLQRPKSMALSQAPQQVSQPPAVVPQQQQQQQQQQASPKFDYVNHHRAHLDQLADILKKEMVAIAHFENRNMTIDTYLATIDQLLDNKQMLINNMRSVIQHQQIQQQQQLPPQPPAATTAPAAPATNGPAPSGLRERARSLIQPPKTFTR
ncbi:hypothetical protein SAMD00019534_097950, partial [Acytostelium subglobosum LB1]|uniref:hypothetical protein n=1 Tax=Acytostelium subglobosum LB1 TaxID=1410327 RepID=UPI000644D904